MIKKSLIVTLVLGTAFFASRYAYVRTYGIRLRGERFLEKADDRDRSTSMSSLRYDGYRDGRVYLNSWEMNRAPRSITYWTELDGIPPVERNQILHEIGRWKVGERNGSESRQVKVPNP